MAIERERDASGRYVKAGQQATKAHRATDKLTNAYAKQFKMMSKGITQLVKLQKSQAKAYAKAEKQITKLAKSQQKLAASIAKTQKTMKAGGRGIGLALPAFLSVAAIAAATKAMASYVTQLARARDIAAAMAGGRRLGLNRRDANLFADYASQDFANRFSSQIEISGLKKIRDTLSKALGPETGRKLALDLTRGFQDSGERARFLAVASKDVVKALKQFQSVDIDTFSTALAGATQETDSLSRTAFTLEKAWRDVQDSFERFVTDFVTRNEIDLTTSIQSVAQGVVDLINWGRKLAAEWQPVFSFFADNLKGLVKQIRSTGKEWQLIFDSVSGLSEGDTRNRIERQIDEANRIGSKAGVLIAQAEQARAAGEEQRAQALIKQARALHKEQQRIMSMSQGFFGIQEDIEPITLGIAASVEQVKLDTQATVDAAKQQRSEFERTLTTVEKVALATQRIREKTSTETLQLDLIRAQLARHEASPFGFGRAFEARLRGAEQLDRLLELNRQRQEQVAKLNLSLRENQERMIRLQIEENTLIGEKNRLLKATQKGYLDAIIAQATGAGKFSKIIIEQDRNLGIALAKGMAKRNPMLGVTGAAARASDLSPFRFSGNMTSDAAGLSRYAEALRKVWQPFIDELRKTIIPPIPRQRIGAAVSKGRSRVIAGKPKSMADDVSQDMSLVTRILMAIAAKIDAKNSEQDADIEPPPTHRPGALANTI